MIVPRPRRPQVIQDKFWEMHDLIYEHQDELDENNLVNFAEALDLNIDKFLRDSKSHAVLSKIESDFESGIRSGVNGTPTFFINDTRLDTYDQTYESFAEPWKMQNNLFYIFAYQGVQFRNNSRTNGPPSRS